MRTLFVLDPLDTLNLATETSLLLMEEMQGRGHASSLATLSDLYLTTGVAGVRARGIRLDGPRIRKLGARSSAHRVDPSSAASPEPFYELGPADDQSFDEFDLVLMRKDPPVDESYLAATHVLERAAQNVLVVNDPVSLRTVNEKLLPLSVPHFAPPTLVSNDAQRIIAFAAQHRRIVLKPLTDCSGRGIQVVEPHQAAAVVGPYLKSQAGRFVVAQQFLEGVRAGDKRIFLLAGEALGAVNRIPQSPDHLANIHQGARVEATELTARERDIIAAIKPMLVERGLWLAGIDVIDGYLTEINVTSPSAVRQINVVSGKQLEVKIVDFLERLAHRK